MLKTLNILYNRRIKKVWTVEAREASAEARAKRKQVEVEDIKRLEPERRQDYWQHRRAGTSHQFAMGLAERGGQ